MAAAQTRHLVVLEARTLVNGVRGARGGDTDGVQLRLGG